MQKPKIAQGGALTYPLFTKKPIFRKATRSPADHTPRKRSQTRSQRKTKGERAQVARTLILLLAQQESKTRGRGSEGTHHHSFRNVFLHTYPFFGNAYIHTHIIIDTIFAAPCHELGRRRIPNHPPMTSPQARGGLWQSHWT